MLEMDEKGKVKAILINYSAALIFLKTKVIILVLRKPFIEKMLYINILIYYLMYVTNQTKTK